MPVQALPQSGMLTSTLAAFPKPWPRRNWSSFSHNMAVSSPRESWLIKSQVKCFFVLSFLRTQCPMSLRNRVLIVIWGRGYGSDIGRFLSSKKDFLAVKPSSVKWAILGSRRSAPWELFQQQLNYLARLKRRFRHQVYSGTVWPSKSAPTQPKFFVNSFVNEKNQCI